MSTSSLYNQQQAEPKQCKSEVEELRIHQQPAIAASSSYIAICIAASSYLAFKN